MAHRLITERLVLRPWSVDDADAALRSYGDAEVARWLAPAMDRVSDLAAMRVVLQQWVAESRLVALISDNYAVEIHNMAMRPGQCAALPLHQHCLFKVGVNLGELWRLSELADWLRANNRSRFLLTAPPLRLPGAVGSPATPVATV